MPGGPGMRKQQSRSTAALSAHTWDQANTRVPHPHAHPSCQVPRHAIQNVPGHPLQFWVRELVRQPAIDDRRLLAGEVEFPD